MKQILKYLTLCCLLSLQAISQSSFTCGTISYSTSPSSRAASQPGTCYQFLQDFYPLSTDSVLQVKVNFIFFSPSTGSGNWDGVTLARVQNAVRQIDSIYANNQAPHTFNNIGAPFISNVRIKFVVNFFSSKNSVGSPLLLGDMKNTTNYTGICSYTTMTPYMVSNSINVFFGNAATTCPSMVAVTPTVGIPYVYRSALNGVEDVGSFDNASGLAHEFGHVLGLDHSTAGQGPSHIDPPFGCCGRIEATDYMEENPLTIYFGDCTNQSTSNNMMSQNVGCNKYLSPMQMAVMHYRLRTDLGRLLTSYSYDNHLKRNAAADYTVTSNETWVNDRYFKGNILVKAGKKLTIGCVVALNQGCKIVVEKQAVVSVIGGTVTNISGHLWNGIQVQGDVNYDQSIVSSTGFGSTQGLLVIDDLAELSNAGTAAMNYVTDASDAVVWSSIGGIIQGYYSNFLNNSRDVEFLSYPNFLSESWFRFCNFKTSGTVNDGLPPFAHVSIWDSYGINFLGCNFEYAAGSTYAVGSRGLGVFSIDANYAVNQYCENSLSATFPCPTMIPTVFSNLDRGIWTINANVLRGPQVTNSQFIDNTTDGIYLFNSNVAKVDNNYIRTANVPGSSGVYLNTCKYYNVKNNTFLEYNNGQTSAGIYANNSGAGAHQIYRNSFAGMFNAVNPLDNNRGPNVTDPGLKMNCNDFTPSSNAYDICLMGNGTGLNAPTVMQVQGAAGPFANATNLVRNKYAASCGNQNKWYASGAGTNTLTITHGCNLDAVCQPTPQPACSNTIVNIVVAPIPLTYSVACLAYPPSSGGGSSNSSNENPTNMNAYLSTLASMGPDADVFELQATTASKLRYFVGDTLSDSKDTVISILSDNRGQMDDADIQLIFAYMNKGDYSTASTLADALGSSRSDWKTLLQTLVAMYQETDKIYSLARVPDYSSLLEEYAADPYRDGSGIAQALLLFVNGIPITEPRPRPGDSDSRLAQLQTAATTANSNVIKVYPNPAQKNVTVSFNSKEEGQAVIELKDLLGNTIYTNFIMSGNELYVPLANYSNGVYIITITKNKEVLYKTKLIKQD